MILMITNDINDKNIMLNFSEIRKIYLSKEENFGEIQYYNGDIVQIKKETYYEIQRFMIDNHLHYFLNRFELPKELQDKYDFDITLIEDYKLLMSLVKKYLEKQMIVAIEELSELQKEICKALRNQDNTNYDNLVEELADVEIMLEQIKIYFEISKSEIEYMKKKKLLRTKERYL